MNYSKIALRYSKALLLLSKEKGLLDVIKDDMLLIQKVYKEMGGKYKTTKKPKNLNNWILEE